MGIYDSVGPGTELVNYYCEGGLHPVNIGDTFNNRYRVVNKLGFGANSTIWLVEDLSLNRFTSLKVVAADASSRSSEIDIVRHIKLQQEQNLVSHPGAEHVIKILDIFTILGPNGTHHCIVTEILGTSLADDVEEFYGDFNDHFPPNVTKKVVTQVSLGVAYLHKCGIVHGDLHLGNVLFYSPKLQSASLEELDRIYGKPCLVPITYRKDGTIVPPSVHLPRSIAVVPDLLPLLEVCLSSVDDVHVKICDFGEASIYKPHRQMDKPFHSNMPRVFAAPEIIFNDIAAPTPSMDIWALGVLIYMIINEKWPPFNSNRGIDKEVVERMVLCLGKLPDKWWKKWEERTEYFDDNSIHLTVDERGWQRTLQSVDSMGGFDEEDLKAFRSLLYKIFRYEPKDRIDAEEVVQLLPHGWRMPCTEKRINMMPKVEVKAEAEVEIETKVKVCGTPTNGNSWQIG
ncbi:kinase-like domain-containing protein [Cyathus striatus]|nr:kinase-like domain-containing protein [Cyathus striatus]